MHRSPYENRGTVAFSRPQEQLDGLRPVDLHAKTTRVSRLIGVALIGSVALSILSGCGTGGESAEHQDVLGECEPEQGLRNARCGQIQVFEDRDRATGRMIDLQVVVFPALDNDPQPDPLFVLVGGPGQGAAQLSSRLVDVFHDVRRERDIVFVDQRGTGKSNGLDCDLESDDLQALFSKDRAVAELEKCLAGYDADLRHYTTPVAMDDLDEVRAKLGYANINIWGGSYGTRAGLVYLRRHGEHVRSIVLDGAVPLAMKLPLSFPEDAQRALDLMVAACETEAACHARFPELRPKLDAVLERLAKRSARVAVNHPTSGAVVDLELHQDVLAGALHAALYSPPAASMIPLLIEQAHAGDFEGLLALALAGESAPAEARVSLGMFFSVVCAEDLPWIGDEELRSRALGTFLGDSTAAMWRRVCAFWPAGSVGADYHEPVRSEIPALALSGAFDPVTPPRWGDQLAEGLANVRHIVVPGAAHGTSGAGCVPDLIAEFIRDGSAEGLQDGCVEELRRPPFFVTHSGPAMGAAE